MTKLIKNWKELAKVPANDTYQIIVDEFMCSGWIIPITDKPTGQGDDFDCNCTGQMYHDFFDHHVYLSTHTFYGGNYKYSTKVLQQHGFDIEIDNWDKDKVKKK